MIDALVADAREVADGALHEIAAVVDELTEFGCTHRPDVVDTVHRVKSATSLARAYVLAEDEAGDVGKFVEAQKDRVRFAVQVDADGYVKSVSATLEALRARGFRSEKMVNFWGINGRHNGLNVTLRSPSGFLMELQFPTPESRSVGKQTHAYYEIVRVEDAPIELRVDAFMRMLRLNKIHGILTSQPSAVRTLRPDKNVDSSLASWLNGRTELIADYQGWLASHGLSLPDMLERHGLSVSDTLRDTRSDYGSYSATLLLLNPDGGGRVGTGDEHPRLPHDRPSPASSGDVERSAATMDLRSADRGQLPLRPRFSGPDDDG